MLIYNKFIIYVQNVGNFTSFCEIRKFMRLSLWNKTLMKSFFEELIIMVNSFLKSLFVLSILILHFSCESDSPTESNNIFIVKSSQVSDCGGFPSESYSTTKSTEDEGEKLIWNYDIKTHILTVLNSSVSLNCCGERTITAKKDENVIIISENDQPDSVGGRCDCICLIDFSIEIEGVSPGTIGLRLDITIDADTYTQWAGTIDLNDVSGEVNINKSQWVLISNQKRVL